jgi:hypothetical protein
VLWGLLEPIVIPVTAPLDGIFHPKIWALRFVPATPGDPSLLRIAVLSRNLTNDRCWDIALALEGYPTNSARPENQALRDLLAALPQMAQQVPQGTAERTRLLADQLHMAEWRLPEGFEELRFDVLGLSPGRWQLPKSDRLAVISPFCSSQALKNLTYSTKEPVLLVSRPEELDSLESDPRSLFQNCMVLRDWAETDDGEDTTDQQGNLRGLHAKVYIRQTGKETAITFGSANATNPAIYHCQNVEILAELKGRREKIGSVDDLLLPEGFGKLLEIYTRGEHVVDEEVAETERRLEAARNAISCAELRLCCAGEGDSWQLSMYPREAIDLHGVSSVRAWPISLHPSAAVDTSGLVCAAHIQLPRCSLAAVTGFVAFELTAGSTSETCRFVLNLPVEGLPVDRRAAVVRTIVASREGFLKYLMLLLADFDEDGLPNEILAALKQWRIGDLRRCTGYPASGADDPGVEPRSRAIEVHRRPDSGSHEYRRGNWNAVSKETRSDSSKRKLVSVILTLNRRAGCARAQRRNL